VFGRAKGANKSASFPPTDFSAGGFSAKRAYLLQQAPGQHFAVGLQQAAERDVAPAVLSNAAAAMMIKRYFIVLLFWVFVFFSLAMERAVVKQRRSRAEAAQADVQCATIEKHLSRRAFRHAIPETPTASNSAGADSFQNRNCRNIAAPGI
jgi:hypothetical protein